MRNVDQAFLDLVTVEDLAAWAFHIDAARLARRPFVRRQSFACIPESIFPSGPVAGIAPLLKIGLGSL